MPDQPSPPLGRFHEVGGRRLLLHRAGAGSPSVVFLAGGGTVGLDYWGVQERAAKLTTSVLYDRSGTGWSEGAGSQPSLAEVTDELRELLRVAAVPGPYVLVGHSLGGLHARLFATRFPGEVAGLLLMETDHEEYDAHMPRELTERWAAFDPDEAMPDELPAEAVALYRELFGRMTADWPAGMREPLIDRHVSPEWIRAGFAVAAHRSRFLDEIRRAGPLPDVPLIVLTATGVDDFKRAVSTGESEELLRAEIDGKRRLYDTLAASVPRGENRLVAGAGHASLHWTHREAVLDAIRDLLGAGT
ncbi:alpha/beta fold hydrolase [Streptomyces mayteni]